MESCLEDVLKTSSERLEDVLKMYDKDEYIGFDQDVLKTSPEDEDKRSLQDVFIKTNVCREVIFKAIPSVFVHQIGKD